MNQPNFWMPAVVSFSLMVLSTDLLALEKIELWHGGARGAVGTGDADKPSITDYPAPADNATTCGIVVCPGGGYQHLALGHEGDDIGKWLNSFGVTGFVLQYRLAPKYKHPSPMLDVQR